MTALTILGLITMATGATLALFAINPRRPDAQVNDEVHDEVRVDARAEHEPLPGPIAMRRSPGGDERGRQLVLRLDRRPDAEPRQAEPRQTEPR